MSERTDARLASRVAQQRGMSAEQVDTGTWPDPWLCPHGSRITPASAEAAVRADKLRHIRQQIREGTYLTQRRIDGAVERLLAELRRPSDTTDDAAITEPARERVG